MTSNKQAMLVRLGISQWYNKATDKNVAKEISDKYGAESTTDDHYVKALLPKNAMKEIQTTIGRMRVAHYRMTMPWQDGGLRILPAKMYFDYVQQMGQLKGQFETQVDTFIKNFRSYKEQAKTTKGGLYNEADYPTEAALRGLFEVRTSFFPLPDSGDFRLDLDADVIERIKLDADKELRKGLEAATSFLYERFATLLETYYQAAANPKKKFHETTIVNLYDFAEMLPMMNISKDEKLDKVAAFVTTELCPYSADSIRDKMEVRTLVAEKAREALHELKAAP